MQAAGVALGALVLAYGVLALTTHLAAPRVSATPTATLPPPASPTATPEPVVLYQADWSHRLAGWQASSGWTVVNGALQSDTGSDHALTIPYRPATTNYAVEFRLEILDVPRYGGYYILSADPAPGRDGYQASVAGLLGPGTYYQTQHAMIFVYIDPFSSENPLAAQYAIHDFVPRDMAQTYRVEVRGPLVSFLVDGRTLSFGASTKTPFLSTGPLRLTSGGAALRIDMLRILTL